MRLIITAVLAFCVGAAGLIAVQGHWAKSVTSQVHAQSTRTPTLPSQFKGKLNLSEGAKFRDAAKKMRVGPIDTTTGQRAAQNVVPPMPRIPSVR